MEPPERPPLKDLSGSAPTSLRSLVRELANERGVSERTVWRWIALAKKRDAPELLERERHCDYCDRPLPEQATLRRRYCDDLCRVRAHRRVHSNKSQGLASIS